MDDRKRSLARSAQELYDIAVAMYDDNTLELTQDEWLATSLARDVSNCVLRAVERVRWDSVERETFNAHPEGPEPRFGRAVQSVCFSEQCGYLPTMKDGEYPITTHVEIYVPCGVGAHDRYKLCIGCRAINGPFA